MRNRRLHAFFIIVTSLSSLTGLTQSDSNLSAQSIITLDGKKTRVFFNDGDTFRIINGKYRGKSVRIAGFNTLENYGPVHSWANMSSIQLSKVAVRATNLARQGNWNCKVLDGADTYHRMLADCDDLALALLEMGLAHAYSIDETPAKSSYLSSQKLAQGERAGMWRGGIPKYIITSLHSTHETRSRSRAYNREVSTEDGHSKMRAHNSTYSPCQIVCMETEKSCMVYVPFEIRYGINQPRCLMNN